MTRFAQSIGGDSYYPNDIGRHGYEHDPTYDAGPCELPQKQVGKLPNGCSAHLAGTTYIDNPPATAKGGGDLYGRGPLVPATDGYTFYPADPWYAPESGRSLTGGDLVADLFLVVVALIVVATFIVKWRTSKRRGEELIERSKGGDEHGMF